mgnify:CR=1 FL=1
MKIDPEYVIRQITELLGPQFLFLDHESLTLSH